MSKSIRWLLICVIVWGFSFPEGGHAQGRGGKVLTLQESIEYALLHSPLLRAAKEGVRGAESQRREARSGFLPRFSTSYSYTRLDRAPAFAMPAIPPLPGGTVTTGTRDNYSWSLEVRQPLFTGGGLTANYEAARISRTIAEQEEMTHTRNIILEVTTAYFNIAKAQNLREVARQTLEQLQAHRNMAGHFFNAGLIPKNDLLQAEVELAAGRQLVLRAENALALAVAGFNTLLGRDMAAPVHIEGLAPAGEVVLKYEELLKLALQNRIELSMADLRIDASRAMVSAARSELFPHVNVMGNFTRWGDDPSVSGSRYRQQESWQVAAVATWNFWEGGRTRHRVDYSQARRRQAEEGRNHLRDQVMMEVKSAYLQLEEAWNQLRVSQAAIGAAEENLRISRLRYLDQVATSTEVLDAQTRLTRVRSDYYTALGDYHIGRARLERAIGR